MNSKSAVCFFATAWLACASASGLTLVGVPADLTLRCDEPVPTPANVTYAGACSTNEVTMPVLVRSFSIPSNANGITVISNGTIYVAYDTHVVRAYTPTGALLFSWGSLGSTPGTFNRPAQLAVDAANRIYVADRDNHRVQVFNSDGSFVRAWGGFGTTTGKFNLVDGVGVNPLNGQVLVADRSNHRVQVFNNDGDFLFSFGSFGTGNGQFNAPGSVEVDPSGQIYVSDLGGNRLQVFDAAGNHQQTIATGGTGAGQLSFPRDTAIDPRGLVYVADTLNNRIQAWDFAGTWLGSFGEDVPGFNQPHGIAVDVEGNVYVVDASSRVLVFATPAFGPKNDLASGLLLHYTFDDPANLGADSSPEENDGVPVNAQSGVGISGSSLLLTGNGYVNVGPFADFHASMEHSYGGWFKPSAVRSAMGIIGNTQSGNVSFHLTIDTINGNYGMDLQRPEIYEVVTSLGKSVAGEWQHGMVTYDGHQAKVYYNGELVATSRYYETAASVVSNGLDTVVGNTATDRDWGFRGDLDDIRVYRRALTAEQIRALASPTTQTLSVVLTETIEGSCPGTITRVWTATDACGASVSATQTITVLAPPPPEKDTDGDGLLDSTEVKIGTDPKKPDTDGDGRSDGIEVQMGTDPLVFDAFPHFVRNDFDGDLISDLGVYDHVSGAWHIFRSRAGYQLTQYGFFGTTPVPGDYDGDKKADIAVFDPANFVWYINGSAGKSSVVQWGFRGTVPMPADYDGDGRTDIAVYHGRFGLYYVNGTKRGTFYKRVFLLGGQPVAGDFDCDRAVDFAVYQPSSAKWKVVFQAGGSKTFTFGDKNARGVAGDYDADGRADFATFNPATGVWNILGSVSGPRKISMPEAIGGQPVTGYYYAQSKNNRVDPAVYLPVTGEWLIWGGEGILLRTTFGSASTTPLGAGP